MVRLLSKYTACENSNTASSLSQKTVHRTVTEDVSNLVDHSAEMSIHNFQMLANWPLAAGGFSTESELCLHKITISKTNSLCMSSLMMP